MKKKLIILILLLVIQLIIVLPAFADLKTNTPTVTVDGEQLNFTVAPIIEDGTTLVQFRPIFEKLGLKIEWDGANQRIIGTKEGLKIELTIGSIIAVKNGKEIPLQKAPRLINGITVIPLRFVGEASGKVVNWDASTQLVSIKDKPSDKAIDIKQIGETATVTSTTYVQDALISDKTKIRNIMKQFTDSFTNKDIDAYVDSQVKVTDTDKQEKIFWYKDQSKYNYRDIINSFDITSIDGNTAKAKVGFLQQAIDKTSARHFISQQFQFVFNVTFTKNKNGDWKISKLDRLDWHFIKPIDSEIIYVED